jgi:hypothetical protein
MEMVHKYEWNILVEDKASGNCFEQGNELPVSMKDGEFLAS